jgi:NhaA family Na+:H+ antiporter
MFEIDNVLTIMISKFKIYMVMVIDYLRGSLVKFMRYQASGGILLLIMTLLAIIFANSNLSYLYSSFLHSKVGVVIGSYNLKMSVEHFVNDGLMVVFFMLVTLEIKREMIEGQLSSRDQQILPVIAALGGVVVPALIYVFLTSGYKIGDLSATRGWAIPAATDIAFALGIMSLLGKKVPTSLKAFLTALAIIDDLIAILIIALFYSGKLNVAIILAAFIVVIFLFLLNKKKVTHKSPYLFLGFILWALIMKSGIHATIAGVLVAIFIPLKDKDENGNSPLKVLEHSVAPWSAFLILPIFAFCNAGVSLASFSFDVLFKNPIALGIMLGLFVGKQIGVFLVVYIAVRAKIATKPNSANWMQIYGVSLLCGIGFTMSVFIGNLAFPASIGITNEVRAGVLSGSLISSLAGFFLLYFAACNVKNTKKGAK